ncbi:hypothetical protein [Streptomyces sp. MJP52]|uniref:hypothetical protein n=1 Tax=Streptomyces sp. MJP52 TaxID=2940555 RepID=UPI0024765863|nr:hypothetical protein [Streptomyces sp. MJP52]MDH6224269.1 hypothetical protein [Streptomyces sp. MJP52]
MARTPRPLPPATRLVNGRICAYDLASDATGVLSPATTFRPVPGDDVVAHTASADLRRACYTTLNAVVCVTAEGDEVWRWALEPWSDERFGHRPACALSADGRAVWVYRPDVMAGRGRPDQWVALDADAGTVLARADLETVGHGGVQLVHPTSGHVLLDVGEGQDGSVVHRAALTDTGMELVRHPGDDRCLIALSPDGRHFMTVDHGQGDVAVHTYPDGEVTFALAVDAFGHGQDDVCVEWSGGYLDPDTIVVALGGETEDEEEWFRHHLVDARSGRVLGVFDAHARDAYDIRPLGDGSWLTTDPSGHPVRRTAA